MGWKLCQFRAQETPRKGGESAGEYPPTLGGISHRHGPTSDPGLLDAWTSAGAGPCRATSAADGSGGHSWEPWEGLDGHQRRRQWQGRGMGPGRVVGAAEGHRGPLGLWAGAVGGRGWGRGLWGSLRHPHKNHCSLFTPPGEQSAQKTSPRRCTMRRVAGGRGPVL